MAKPKKQEITKAEKAVIANGKLIEEVMRTKGWKQLIEPVFDEIVNSVIGVKKNGRWLQGHFVKSRKDEKKEFYIGYVCAAQEIWNSIQNYVFSAEAVKRRLEEVAEIPKNQVIPMVNDEEEVEDIQEA